MANPDDKPIVFYDPWSQRYYKLPPQPTPIDISALNGLLHNVLDQNCSFHVLDDSEIKSVTPKRIKDLVHEYRQFLSLRTRRQITSFRGSFPKRCFSRHFKKGSGCSRRQVPFLFEPLAHWGKVGNLPLLAIRHPFLMLPCDPIPWKGRRTHLHFGASHSPAKPGPALSLSVTGAESDVPGTRVAVRLRGRVVVVLTAWVW
jgi:hypothetical protein